MVLKMNDYFQAVLFDDVTIRKLYMGNLYGVTLSVKFSNFSFYNSLKINMKLKTKSKFSDVNPKIIIKN